MERKVKTWKPQIIKTLSQRDMSRQTLVKAMGANSQSYTDSLRKLLENGVIQEVDCTKDKESCKQCLEPSKRPKKGPKKSGVPSKCLTLKPVPHSEEELKKLVENHESVIPYLQKNDRVIGFLADEHFPGHFPELDEDEDEPLEPYKERFKEMLKKSRNFFKVISSKSRDDLIEAYRNHPIFWKGEVVLWDLYEHLFKVSVENDIVQYGESEAHNTLKEIFKAREDFKEREEANAFVQHVIEIMDDSEVYEEVLEIKDEFLKNIEYLGIQNTSRSEYWEEYDKISRVAYEKMIDAIYKPQNDMIFYISKAEKVDLNIALHKFYTSAFYCPNKDEILPPV